MKSFNFGGHFAAPSSLFLSLFIVINASAQQQLLFEPSTRTGNINLKTGPEVVQSQNITFRTALLQQGANTLRANLFGETITISRRRDPLSPDKSFVWWGSIAGDPGSYVLFSRSGSVFAGNILRKNTLYQIRFVGNNVYQLRKVDQQKFPAQDETSEPYPEIKLPGNEFKDPCPNTDPPSVIDVMVVYTDDVRSAAGSKDIVEAEIYLAAHETNLSYFNSDVTQRIGLVHVSEVSYSESGSSLADVNWAQSNATLQALRDAHAADIVVLLVESLTGCGRAYDILDPVAASFESSAYCVVRRNCATGNYSFGHELAHLMGCRHDCDNDNTLTPYNYAHGYEYCGVGAHWRTVMSYNNCSSTRLPYFSNPVISYAGNPTGTTGSGCQADNHQVLNNTALTVANFRCHSSSVGNVWMKDSWADTGLEPDPATAADAMWISPYIWIRNSQDVDLLHQHQHDNPVLGSSNWVYVKLHNGGPAASGNLEFYYANASLSLTWPGGWTPLATIPLSIGASSSQIVEHEWNTLPGTGHYCMIARWVSSSDPMAVPEGADINLNVRNNNNIAWRNLNIVDMVMDSEDRVEMEFRPIKGSWVEIKFDNTFPNKSYIPLGKVEISFDDQTIGALGAVGIKGSGFKKKSNNLFEANSSIVRFDNVGTGKDYTGKIVLRFIKNPNTPKGKYYCSVKQAVKAQTQSGTRSIGGVNYQINLDYR
jgi:Metallo-peptidase family M12